MPQDSSAVRPTNGLYLYLLIEELHNYVITVKLKDRKRALSGKNNHNALWNYRNSHNAKFCVVEVTVKTVRV